MMKMRLLQENAERRFEKGQFLKIAASLSSAQLILKCI